MRNIAVLVSGGGTNLQAILDAQASGAIKSGKICLVIGSRDGIYALKRAQDAGVENCVISPKQFADISGFGEALLKKLSAYETDLIVLAGYLSILPPEVVKAYDNRIINVHPALIPSFSGKGCYGLKVHQMALDRGVKVSGATVHFINERVDDGPIIFQKAVDVLENDTPETLQKRIMKKCEQVLLPKAVELYCAGRLSVQNGKAVIKG